MSDTLKRPEDVVWEFRVQGGRVMGFHADSIPTIVDIDVAGAELPVLRRLWQRLADHKPLLHLAVYPERMRARGDEPADLHRLLAEIQYVPRLLSEEADAERWEWYHPDGRRP